jgi:hypothetical protein
MTPVFLAVVPVLERKILLLRHHTKIHQRTHLLQLVEQPIHQSQTVTQPPAAVLPGMAPTLPIHLRMEHRFLQSTMKLQALSSMLETLAPVPNLPNMDPNMDLDLPIPEWHSLAQAPSSIHILPSRVESKVSKI